MAVIGYAPGVYDLFHVGHLNILRRAAEHCEHLVAGVVTDDVVRRAKGRKPVVPFEERCEILRSIRHVDEVVADPYVDKFDSWREFRYNLIFKGDDWRGTKRADLLERRLAEVGAGIVYFPYTRQTSSTLLRRVVATVPVDGSLQIVEE